MPNELEASSTSDGTGAMFLSIENYFNDPATRATRRQEALARLSGGIDNASGVDLTKPALSPVLDTHLGHFAEHWLGSPTERYWPSIEPATVKQKIGAAFDEALRTDLPIAIVWTCTNPDPASGEFGVFVSKTAHQATISIVTPRPTGPDSWGFAATAAGTDDKWGPLRHLCGYWQGSKGVDFSYHNAEDDVDERGSHEFDTPYWESISFSPFDVENGAQHLFGLNYRMAAWRDGYPGDKGGPFHTEVGYWLWDGALRQVYRSFMVPRGVTLMAIATDVEPGAKEFTLRASEQAGRADQLPPEVGGIISNPYLVQHARTTEYRATVKIHDDLKAFDYAETTTITLKATGEQIEHTDENTLRRV